MANSITLAKTYTNLLDEVYQQAALTADLESDASLARAGANANEIVIPKISSQMTVKTALITARYSR